MSKDFEIDDINLDDMTDVDVMVEDISDDSETKEKESMPSTDPVVEDAEVTEEEGLNYDSGVEDADLEDIEDVDDIPMFKLEEHGQKRGVFVICPEKGSPFKKSKVIYHDTLGYVRYIPGLEKLLKGKIQPRYACVIAELKYEDKQRKKIDFGATCKSDRSVKAMILTQRKAADLKTALDDAEIEIGEADLKITCEKKGNYTLWNFVGVRKAHAAIKKKGDLYNIFQKEASVLREKLKFLLGKPMTLAEVKAELGMTGKGDDDSDLGDINADDLLDGV